MFITSDHGEELGEHGLFGHGRSLYSQEVHVPLVVLTPRSETQGKVVGEPVSFATCRLHVSTCWGLPMIRRSRGHRWHVTGTHVRGQTTHLRRRLFLRWPARQGVDEFQSCSGLAGANAVGRRRWQGLYSQRRQPRGVL